MGLKNALDAANRYGENKDILKKTIKHEIEYGTPEDEKQFDYFIRSKGSSNDINTILNTAIKSLEANGQEANAENLDKFFTSLIRIYYEDYKRADKPPVPATMDNPEVNSLLGEFKEDDHFGEEQAEGLDNLLEGLRDTPHDNRW